MTKIHIVRLKKNANLELFIDQKKKETMLINHEFYVNVDVIFVTIRLKFKMFKKFVKHHELIKRILKKKEKKRKNCLSQKSCDRVNKKKLR